MGGMTVGGICATRYKMSWRLRTLEETDLCAAVEGLVRSLAEARKVKKWARSRQHSQGFFPTGGATRKKRSTQTEGTFSGLAAGATHRYMAECIGKVPIS